MQKTGGCAEVADAEYKKQPKTICRKNLSTASRSLAAHKKRASNWLKVQMSNGSFVVCGNFKSKQSNKVVAKVQKTRTNFLQTH